MPSPMDEGSAAMSSPELVSIFVCFCAKRKDSAGNSHQGPLFDDGGNVKRRFGNVLNLVECRSHGNPARNT
jgi:hypothetical protein